MIFFLAAQEYSYTVIHSIIAEYITNYVLNAYYRPGMLRILSLIFSVTPQVRDYYIHFIDKRPEARRIITQDPIAGKWKSDFEPGLSYSKVYYTLYTSWHTQSLLQGVYGILERRSRQIKKWIIQTVNNSTWEKHRNNKKYLRGEIAEFKRLWNASISPA